MKVKICANKSITDAQMSLSAGADIIGILVGQVHASSDFVDKNKAKEIVDFVNKQKDTCLVTHLTKASEIIELTKYIGNSMIQLHSDIAEDEVQKIVEALPYIKLIRVIHVTSNGHILTNYQNMKYKDYYLLDSINPQTNQVGGTGLTHNWSVSRKLVQSLDKPVFLAGGLTPKNVQEAIKIVQPYGVDVNSGCKNELGQKDSKKVAEFVSNAKKVA